MVVYILMCGVSRVRLFFCAAQGKRLGFFRAALAAENQRSLLGLPSPSAIDT